MELLSYWKLIRKRLLLILLIGAAAAGLAAYNESRRVPLYTSTTTLFLNPAAANPLLPFQATKTVLATANTYMEFMRTRSFAGLVAQQSGLALSPEQVTAALSSEYVPDTQFFRISATFTDPAVAQRIAATAASTLIAENAARQQAEQAQIQSQRDQDPERQQLAQLRDTLREELTLYTQRIQATQEQIAAIEVRLPSERNDERLTELRAELVDLQQARSQTLNSLAQVQASLVGSSPAAAAATDTAVVVDPAPLPGAPLPQPFLRTLLLWAAAGLALGVGLALALEYLDYTVRSPEGLESAYGLPVQGVIGMVGGRARQANGAGYQLTASEPRSPAAESIRALRTSVQITALSRPLRSLLVTSAGPGEGKTFTATNLAVSMAQYGHRVILVDLDLRKPNLHTVFGVAREPGFTNLALGREADLIEAQRAPHGAQSAKRMPSVLLADRRPPDDTDEFDDYLRATGVAGLRLLTAGTVPPHPSELLGSPRAVQLMERLQAHADLVIYDSPPAGIVTDAVILAPRVDGVLHVVCAGKTRIDLIRRCKAILGQAGGQLIGPVLNQVRLADMGSYGYYYGYGYGEGK